MDIVVFQKFSLCSIMIVLMIDIPSLVNKVLLLSMAFPIVVALGFFEA